jgi:hypothetical protein
MSSVFPQDFKAASPSSFSSVNINADRNIADLDTAEAVQKV